MAVRETERALLGQALEPIERALLGVVGAIGAAGHAALVVAALTFPYVVAVALV